MTPLVSVLMGSDSDLPVMAECCRVLEELGIAYEVHALSAHRTPDAVAQHAGAAAGRGLKVLVAGAGGAAHLAGVVAAHSTLPVIAVPVDSTPLAGLDALLSSVQMPAGTPVACVAVGRMGAANAGFLAARILALSDPALGERVAAARKERAESVLRKDAGLETRLRELLKKS